MMKNTLLILLSTSSIALAQQGKPSWERVSKHDADNDGKVTKVEFKGPEHAFTRFDANKDGAITQEEMKNFTGPNKGGGGKGQKKGGKGGRQESGTAPAVGEIAPQLKAQTLGSEEMVDLGKIKKPTVLIFGSYT